MSLNESIVEDKALEWFGELGYAFGHGHHIVTGESAPERDSFGELVLVGRLREAIRCLNLAISHPTLLPSCAKRAIEVAERNNLTSSKPK
jgi:hypothetical protein